MEADDVHSVVFLTPLSFFRIRIIFAEPKLQYIPVKSKTQIGCKKFFKNLTLSFLGQLYLIKIYIMCKFLQKKYICYIRK